MAHLVKFLTESPEVVVLLLYLVVPGFVFVRVYDLLAPGERRSLGGAIIDTLGTSFIFMMFWFWPFASVCRDDNVLLNSKYPDKDGTTPLGGAY